MATQAATGGYLKSTVTGAALAKNYYEILGVPRNAGEKEIKAAYHRLARSLHPDKAATAEERERVEHEFAQISQAYNTLKDKEKRDAYDKTLSEAQEKAGGGAAGGTGGGSGSGGPAGGGAGLEKSRATVARRAYLRGLQAMAAGDYTKAVEFFEAAIKNKDDEAAYYAKLAQTLLRAKRSFSRAIEAAQQAIQLDPYNVDYRLVLAELYEETGARSMALKTYEEILKWDPTNERALAAVGPREPPTAFQKIMKAIRSFLGRE
jgi:curved DNA-binding protein CbpA